MCYELRESSNAFHFVIQLEYILFTKLIDFILTDVKK